jgi:hypothetical protein
MRQLAWCICALSVGCGSSVKVAPPLPGELIGSVEISADVPATGCQVLLEGTPLGARCDETGTFDVRNVPPGRWDLRLVTDGAANALPARRVAAGSNPGQVTDLGPVRLAKPGSVGGHILNGAPATTMVIAVPELGVVTAPNDNGGYLLEGVSPGVHQVVLITDDGTVVKDNITVLPGQVTIGADFDLAGKQVSMVGITGHARRSDKGDGQHGGITVDLVEDLDGKVVATTQTGDDGSFQLTAQQGTYIIRAHDGTNPITAIVPSLVLHGAKLDLTTALVITPQHGDLNGDGVPDDMDPDTDGDGVLNSDDAFPLDPAESKDTDGDGVGDRADLKSMGGTGVDSKNPTPDTDGDGKLDFEDNCPKVANANQLDSDGDGVGDVCDNCPFTANPDQQDSVGNGIGDACRACHQNNDCGAGKICQFGACVDCLTNAQCGDKVCSNGKCVACTGPGQCAGGLICSLGHCEQCATAADCGPNQQCVQNQCFAQCSNDSSCPGGYCVSGVCAACRNSGDCPNTQYCAQGTCHPQCTVNADCTGAQICDTNTKTCVTPCSAMCPSGQACDSGSVCRPLCDQSRPCASGTKCSAQSLCVPECANNGDCTAAHTICMLPGGQCVPDGTCTLDSDCTVDKTCIGSTCTPRATSLVSGKGYTCSTACDCRMGEACLVDAGDGKTYCKPDVVPTKFMVPGGTGNGLSPLTPAGASVTFAANDVAVALATGAFTFSAGWTVNQNGVQLIGGYASCGPNRWVRDPSQRTTINFSGTALTATGTLQAPLTGFVLRNWVFNQTNAGPGGGVTTVSLSNLSSPVIDRNSLGFPSSSGGNNFTGLGLSNASNITFTNNDTPGVTDGSGPVVTVFSMGAVDGLIDGNSLGAMAGMSTLDGLLVASTTGALTIRNTTADLLNSAQGAGIWVQAASGGPLTVTQNTLPWNMAGPASSWEAIQVTNAPTVSVTKNVIDGRTQSNSGGEVSASHYGIVVDHAAGTIDQNTIYFPVDAISSSFLGFQVSNLTGPISFTNNTSSGGSANFYYLAYFTASAASNLLTISGNNLSEGNSYQGNYGVLVDNIGAFVMTDNTITINGTQTNYGNNYRSTALYVNPGSVGRIERNRFINNTTWNTTGASGGYFVDGSSTEVYDNWFVGGVTTQAGVTSSGMQLDGPGQSFAAQVVAIGNTLYAGGKVGSTGWSCALFWGNDSTLSFTSNIFDAGVGTGNPRTMCGGNFNPGGQLANFHNNYLQTSGSSSPAAASAPFDTLAAGMTDANNNINGNLNNCFDPVNPKPDYRLLANGPCVNKGVAGTRKDTSTITQDVDKMTRVLGTAADIGCSEKQ